MKTNLTRRWGLRSALLVGVLAFTFGWGSFGAEKEKEKDSPPFETRHQPQQPRSGQLVEIIVKAKTGPKISAATLEYQLVDPGKYIELADSAFKSNWVRQTMHDDGKEGDAKAGDGEFTFQIPASEQIHRRLVRYRCSVETAGGGKGIIPAKEDSVPNLAYFVYDGVPGWTGAVNPKANFGGLSKPIYVAPIELQRVPVYHLIGNGKHIKDVTWYNQDQGKDYHYTGTFVYDGIVYDHVRYRARGGVWRFAMGKNMWKIDFNAGHGLKAKDDYGRPYQTKWSKLNLRACIQQGDYGERGEQGMFEAVGFRLFNLAGTPAPRTHFVHWRMIGDAAEAPANQYEGDFWGLYLAIENEDEHFIKEHDLPPGEVYKMMNGQGLIASSKPGTPTQGGNVAAFLRDGQRSRSLDYWKEKFELERYYSYRTILEAIHHYDVDAGKNYSFYFDAAAKKWTVVPWDIDLTWGDHMFGGGMEPMVYSVLNKPQFRLQYENRLREIRDLLYNPEQTGQLIDECAALIWDPTKPSLVDADRMKWDYNPIMNSRYAMQGKAGTGLFYQASPTHDFAGMVKNMKSYVKSRGAWMDQALSRDGLAPARPKISGPPATQVAKAPLELTSSEYTGQVAAAAMQWRLGEFTPPPAGGILPRGPRKFEITPVWQSGTLTNLTTKVTVPEATLTKGGNYRARVRYQDASGRWSHWSEPYQFKVQD